MTVTDSPLNQYRDPVEVVARAMGNSEAWPAVFAAGSARVLAEAALAALNKHGFLSSHYYDAVLANKPKPALREDSSGNSIYDEPGHDITGGEWG